MANREFYDLIIIGGGPDKLSAGIYALRASMRTVLIEQGMPGGQVMNSEAVENYPGFVDISGFDPQNNLVPAGTKQNADGYVITDEKCETNVPGLFAIVDRRQTYARQIVLSAADGCLVALAASHWVETRRASES
jgi:thioredoxin reductase (NADPH)